MSADNFETHYTVAFDERLPAWAGRFGLKYTRIQLDRGACTDQPMLTSTGSGDLSAQRAAAGVLVGLLQHSGFTVRRVKIEAAPWNSCVPSHDGPTGGCYFEHHVKLVLAADDIAAARSVAEGHGAHVSRNARRVRDDGRHERFVTQRCHDVGRPHARRRLDALLADLAGQGLTAVEVEEEYVVVDDNPALDAGWDPLTAHRDVLDHVLAVVAADPVGDSLVLRGSMTMPAWVGGRARPPGDLDWVVRQPEVRGVDTHAPYPFLDRIDPVQYWPEATQGAGRAQPWTFQDEDTGGVRALLPPDGLRWMHAEEIDPDDQPHVAVLGLLERAPRTPGGVVLDIAGAHPDRDWDYAGFRLDYGGAAGARVQVPWRLTSSGVDLTGTVQLDFAYDESLPEPPVLTAVPRGAGGPPTAAWTASPALSLLWKLQWLAEDQTREGASRGKDVYDAVLLAELDVTLSPRLRRRLPSLDPDALRSMTVDWSSHPVHDPDSWLDRLAWAVQQHCAGYETER